MSTDLKSYLKSSKNTQMQSKSAQDMATQLSKKSSEELSSDFQSMLAKAKQEGTFNKDEMLQMLDSIKSSMGNGEYERVKKIIRNL